MFGVYCFQRQKPKTPWSAIKPPRPLAWKLCLNTSFIRGLRITETTSNAKEKKTHTSAVCISYIQIPYVRSSNTIIWKSKKSIENYVLKIYEKIMNCVVIENCGHQQGPVHSSRHFQTCKTRRRPIWCSNSFCSWSISERRRWKSLGHRGRC